MGYHVDGISWAGKYVVPHVLANTGTVGAERNLNGAKGGGGPDARDHEELWGAKLYVRCQSVGT